MNFPFIKYSKFYFIFSGLLVAISLGALLTFGLNWGIDFVGGSVLQATYKDSLPNMPELKKDLSALDIGNFSARFSGDKDVIIRMANNSQEKKTALSEFFYNNPSVEKSSINFESISPIVGRETKSSAWRAIIYSIIAIILYVAIAFRKVSRPVKSWQYGVATIIALVHDVLIPVGVFAFLGKFMGVEFSIPILTAMLTIFGYSVNDTVVVFDRIRENLLTGSAETFKDAVNESLNQTWVRSFNTSFTTLLVLIAIFFFGGVSLKFFALALMIGTISGTYSSIFLASTLLVKWLDFQHRNA